MNNIRSILVLFLMTVGYFIQGQVVISEVADPGDDFNQRFVEITNLGGTDVDISGYILNRYANGGTNPTSITVDGGTLLASGESFLFTENDFSQSIACGAQSGGAISGNGDDVYELTDGSNPIDIYGVLGVDGTGENWEYENAIVTRNESVTSGTTTFDISEWTITAGDIADATPCVSNFNTSPRLVVSPTSLSVAEGGTSTFDISLSEAPSSDVVVNLTVSSGTTDLTISQATVTLSNSTPQTITVTGVEETDADGSQNVTITIAVDDAASDDTFDGQSEMVSVTVSDNDGGTSYDLIHTIQGNGTSVVAGDYTVQGIVTAVFDGYDGFFMQEEDDDWDADPSTSEGIFVYTGSGSTPSTEVSVGDLVVVEATAEEFNDHSQLTSPTITVVSNNNNLPTTTTLTLPLDDFSEFENYEGMLVAIDGGGDNLVVNEHFNYDRFGEVSLSVGGQLNGRWVQFTQVNTPSISGFTDYQDLIARSSILVDDGQSGSNPFPIINARGGNNLSPSNTLRGGDEVSVVTGVLGYGFGSYRLQPTEAINYQASNPRPTTLPEVGGDIKVAAMNVLNYFNTLGQRGAETSGDFDVQESKLVAAFEAINADVVALQEIENDGFGSGSSIQDLVDAINAQMGAGTYDFVSHSSGSIGNDQIAVGIIYKPATLTPIGTSAILDTPSETFTVSRSNRVPLAQTFESISGEQFTVVSVHMKSKGSVSDGSGNTDIGDGAANNNQMRLDGVQALRNWLTTNPTGIDTDFEIVLGDFNAYRMEDPIQDMETNGYTNLFASPTTYSFSFSEQWGSLDYAFVSDALASFVSGQTKFHINADEPDALDYSSEFKDPSLRDPNSFYRSSDHDPLVLGLDFTPTTSTDLAALATCSDVTTDDEFKIQLSNLTDGETYGVDWDNDGAADETFTASGTTQLLTNNFNFTDGTVVVNLAVDAAYDGSTFTADGNILVHELKCIDIDNDGTIDNNIALCDPNATDENRGVIMAQAAPYNGSNVYVYVLTDNNDVVVAANTSGYFEGLANDSDLSDMDIDEYKMYAYNVIADEASTFLSKFTEGTSVTSIAFDDISCYTHCTASGQPTFNVNCGGCPVVTALSVPSAACISSGFDINLEASNLGASENSDRNFGINVYYWESADSPADPYDGSQAGTLASTVYRNLTQSGNMYTYMMSGVGTALPAGTYQICAVLNEEPTDGSCRPSQCVTITIDERPTLSVPGNGVESICANETSFDLNATATFAGSINWTTTNGAGTIAGNSYTVDAADINNSPIRFEAEVMGQGACSNETASGILLLNITDTQCGTFPWGGGN